MAPAAGRAAAASGAVAVSVGSRQTRGAGSCTGGADARQACSANPDGVAARLTFKHACDGSLHRGVVVDSITDDRTRLAFVNAYKRVEGTCLEPGCDLPATANDFCARHGGSGAPYRLPRPDSVCCRHKRVVCIRQPACANPDKLIGTGGTCRTCVALLVPVTPNLLEVVDQVRGGAFVSTRNIARAMIDDGCRMVEGHGPTFDEET